MNQHTFPAPPPGHFITVVNMIYNGTFHVAGQPRPLSELKEIPLKLRREEYIIRHSGSAPAKDVSATLNYTIGAQYDVDENGLRRPKHIQREVIDLQQAQREQEYWEARASAEPDEQTKAALEIVQEDFESEVARDKAALAYQAKENDQANALAVAAQQEEDAEISQLSGNHMISPAVGQIPEETVEAKPKRMRKRFVCRNGTWLRVKRLKRFHIGEKVYVRTSAGEFISIGVVNKRGGLPAAYLEN